MKPVKHKLPLPKQLAPGSSGQSQSFHEVPRPWCQWSSRAPYAAGQGPSVRRMKKIFNGRCLISCLPRGCLPVALCSSSPTDPNRAHISWTGLQLFDWVRKNSHLLSLLQHPLLGQRVAHLEICSHDILNKSMLYADWGHLQTRRLGHFRVFCLQSLSAIWGSEQTFKTLPSCSIQDGTWKIWKYSLDTDILISFLLVCSSECLKTIYCKISSKEGPFCRKFQGLLYGQKGVKRA